MARLDNNLSTVQAATILGGGLEGGINKYEEEANCLAIDGEGNVWVASHTNQSTFPVTAKCLDSTLNGEADLFLSKLDPYLSQLLASTFICRSQNEAPTDMLLDSHDKVYLPGWTFSGNFPKPAGGYDTNYGNAAEDGFILKLNAAAESMATTSS